MQQRKALKVEVLPNLVIKNTTFVSKMQLIKIQQISDPAQLTSSRGIIHYFLFS